ncbi:MAG: cupin domain-containing protein, partial [Candidatus Altiarchaeota archaeon]|nr:cupin domain-containing protein [Candidatus Altiarchaeota archaeon]
PGSKTGKGFRVKQFFEKPCEADAKKYLLDGFLWNSGMFVFDSEVLLKETRKHSPESMPAYEIGEKAFDTLPSQSIDKGIMEQTDNSLVIPLKAKWNDLGSFSSFFEIMKKENGNIVTNSEVLSHGARNSLVFTENGKKKLVTLVDVEDLVIVDAPDALLIAPMKSTQKVGDIVKYLKKNDDSRATTHQSTHRPWGFYVDLESAGRYRLKRIVVYSGKRLSLQKHYNRSEHWVVVRGTAKATIGDNERVLRAGESVFIPVGSKHRLENPGKIPLEIIEVQIGDYTGEDDIVREQDDFGRN